MKCLSINIWNLNAPLETRMQNLGSFISTSNPDIICFQEVSKINNRIQIEDILNNNLYYYYYHKSGIWERREEGLVIASKYPIVRSKSYRLPMRYSFNDMQRILLCSHININNCDVIVYNTHLSYHEKSGRCRAKQIKYITKKISASVRKHYNVILCGDFNLFDYERENAISTVVRKTGLCDCWYGSTVNTFSSDNKYVSETLWPDRKLDFIFSAEKMNMHSQVCLCQTDGFNICSDHYGVIAEGELV